MFSGRVPASLEPGPWARRLARLRERGVPLIDLTEHNPTTAGLDYLEPDALAALADPAGRAYAPDPRGDLAAREAIAAYHAERGGTVGADDIVLTAGTSEGYAHAFRLLCEPGDAVLVPRPGYPLVEPLAHAESVRVASYPLRHGAPRVGGTPAWRLDPAGLDAALDAAPRTRAVVAVHPNHPTGSRLSRDEARAVIERCAGRGLALVADEVFADFAFAGGRPAAELHPTFAGTDGCLTLTLSGLSKVCGLPQLKVGWIVVSGPGTLRRGALERLEWLADAFLSVAPPAQRAVPALLAARGRFQRAVAARVAANRAALAVAVARLPGAALLPADGGWSAIVALPAVRADEEWALALLEHEVVVHPGYFYDFEEPGRLVLSLLPAPGPFAEALARLARVAAG